MKVNICAIIKNEQRFLKEWIDYHLNLGINHIVLFEDFTSDSHLSITKDYSEVELIPLKDNLLGIKNYYSSLTLFACYKYYLNKCRSAGLCDWVLFIDIDEFLFFEEGYNLQTFLEEYKNTPSIHLSWKFMGANGHIKRPKGGVLESYTQPCPRNGDSNYWSVKSLINIHSDSYLLDIHHGSNGVRTNGSKNLNSDLNYEKAWINHYYTKSWEDFCDRIFSRGNLHNNFRTLDSFFKCNPEFLMQKRTMILQVSHLHTADTMWISKDLKIISGGNINKLKLIKQYLNNK